MLSEFHQAIKWWSGLLGTPALVFTDQRAKWVPYLLSLILPFSILSNWRITLTWMPILPLLTMQGVTIILSITSGTLGSWVHTWVSFCVPEYTESASLTILFNILAGTFSEAVLEDIKGHSNAEFVTEGSEQSDEFELITQFVMVPWSLQCPIVNWVDLGMMQDGECLTLIMWSPWRRNWTNLRTTIMSMTQLLKLDLAWISIFLVCCVPIVIVMITYPK